MSPPRTGTFAYLLSLRYRIDPDRVTIAPTRYGWVAVSLMVIGGVTLAIGGSAFYGFGQYLMIPGVSVLVAGVLVNNLTPSGPPGHLACTRDGIHWGDKLYPRSQIKSVAVYQHTYSGRRSRISDSSLEVQLIDGSILRWSVVSTQLFPAVAKQRTAAVVAAIEALLREGEEREHEARVRLCTVLRSRIRALPPVKQAPVTQQLAAGKDLAALAVDGRVFRLSSQLVLRPDDGAWSLTLGSPECTPERVLGAFLALRGDKLVADIGWEHEKGGQFSEVSTVTMGGTLEHTAYS